MSRGQRQAIRLLFDEYERTKSVAGILTLIDSGNATARAYLDSKGGYVALIEKLFPVFDSDLLSALLHYDQNDDKWYSKPSNRNAKHILVFLAFMSKEFERINSTNLRKYLQNPPSKEWEIVLGGLKADYYNLYTSKDLKDYVLSSLLRPNKKLDISTADRLYAGEAGQQYFSKLLKMSRGQQQEYMDTVKAVFRVIYGIAHLVIGHEGGYGNLNACINCHTTDGELFRERDSNLIFCGQECQKEYISHV